MIGGKAIYIEVFNQRRRNKNQPCYIKLDIYNV